jgi:cell shape-determining protein MreC
MPYNPGKPELSAEKKAMVLVLILFIDLMMISSQIVLKNRQSLLQAMVANLIAPLQLTLQKSSDLVVSGLNRYLFLRGAFEKHRALKKKHLDLKIENYALKKKLRERHAIKGNMGRFARFRTATLIAVDVNFPYSSLTIDRGSHAGLKENDVVLNEDAELVGKITQPLTPFSATVRLITSSIGGTGASIEGNMLEGLLRGHDGPNCSFHYLLAGKEVRLGSMVITSGTDLIYPGYLPLGKVTRVEPGYLTQTITVRPFFVDKPLKKLVVLSHE